MRNITCPVALHPDGTPSRLPVFEGPEGDIAVIRGEIRAGERPERAAALRLIEQSGLETRATLILGASDDIEEGARWHFTLCRVVPPVRDWWQHSGAGGALHRFGWATLDDARLRGCDARARDWIRGML